MTTSRDRTGLSPDKTPDWIPEPLRLGTGEQLAKIKATSSGGLGIDDGVPSRGIVTAEISGGAATGNFS